MAEDPQDGITATSSERPELKVKIASNNYQCDIVSQGKLNQ